MACLEINIGVRAIFKHHDEVELEGVADLLSWFPNGFINYFAILPIMCFIILEALAQVVLYVDLTFHKAGFQSFARILRREFPICLATKEYIS